MATQKEIAERLNISQQAVSASLDEGCGTAKVSLETRKRVREIAQELGYVPNQVARSFRSGRTSIIGVLMPFADDPYFSAVIDALSMEAVTRKYSLMLQLHFWSGAEEEEALRRLIEARVDGILIHTRATDYKGTQAERLIKATRVPVVAINSTNAEKLFTGILDKDHEEEGFLLGSEFLRRGHRNLDLLAATSDHFIQRRRLKGVQLAIRKAGVAAKVQHVNLPAEQLVNAQPQAPAPISARKAIIRQVVEYYTEYQERGTAVVVGNEAVAWKLMSVASAKGIRIPEELSVACSGIQGQGDTGPVPLTSVEYDQIGRAHV